MRATLRARREDEQLELSVRVCNEEFPVLEANQSIYDSEIGGASPISSDDARRTGTANVPTGVRRKPVKSPIVVAAACRSELARPPLIGGEIWASRLNTIGRERQCEANRWLNWKRPHIALGFLVVSGVDEPASIGLPPVTPRRDGEMWRAG